MKKNNNKASNIYCEFDFCIYNKDYDCICKSISISSAGVCDSRVVPAFPEEVLEKYKKEHFQKFEN